MALHITSLPASSVSPDELRLILAEYVALDHARVLRQLFVVRFGVLAVVAALAGTVIPGFSPVVRWLAPALLLIPVAWAVVAELRLSRRLGRRLRQAEGARSRHPQI